MSHISKKFTEALKEINLDASAAPKSMQGGSSGFHAGKWVAIAVFVAVVILLIAVLMRDTQPKNVVFERLPATKKRTLSRPPKEPAKRVRFEEEEEEEKEVNTDPNFTLLSDLVSAP